MENSSEGILFRIDRRVPDAVMVSVNYQNNGGSRGGSFPVYFPGDGEVSMAELVKNPEFLLSYGKWLKNERFTPRSLREDV